jgi:hypothetical protein
MSGDLSGYTRSMFESDDLMTRYLRRPKPSGIPANLLPIRGGFDGEHEISNRFTLTEGFPVPFRSGHEPLSYD